jgi:hypothetical protein
LILESPSGVKIDDGIAKPIYPTYNQITEEKFHIKKGDKNDGK